MRIKLDDVTAHNVEAMARRENRSAADVVRRLVTESMIAARRGQSSTPAIPASDEESCIKGRTIALHAPGSVCFAVQHVAEREGRSLSSTLKLLLRESLQRRGELRQGNDPVGARPHG
jgi:hypothetical protein